MIYFLIVFAAGEWVYNNITGEDTVIVKIVSGELPVLQQAVQGSYQFSAPAQIGYRNSIFKLGCRRNK